jgi:hypothetical protein
VKIQGVDIIVSFDSDSLFIDVSVGEAMPAIINKFHNDNTLSERSVLLVEPINHRPAGSLFENNILSGGR